MKSIFQNPIVKYTSIGVLMLSSLNPSLLFLFPIAAVGYGTYLLAKATVRDFIRLYFRRWPHDQ